MQLWISRVFAKRSALAQMPQAMASRLSRGLAPSRVGHIFEKSSLPRQPGEGIASFRRRL